MRLAALRARVVAACPGLAALAALALTQAAVPTSPEQQAHRAAVRTERTAAFFAAWAGADEARRRATGEALEGGVPRGAPLGARPSLAALGAATRVLGGEPAEDELGAFADSLDLQVRPGAFAAVGPEDDEDRGAPLTIRVYRLWHLPAARDAQLSLFWLGPGGERIQARSEPFGAQAFQGRGFDMFVHAPRSGPGTWRLQPVLRVDGRDAAGPAVPVACVADLDARLAAVPAPGAETGGSSGANAALADLLARGLRRAEVRGADELLSLVAAPERGVWTGLAQDAGAAGPRVVGHAPAAPGNGALVFFWTGAEAEEVPLRGPVGDAWRALADERGLGLFTLVAAPGGPGEPGALRRGLELVARVSGADPILIARGTSATTALLLLAASGAQPLDLAGFVLAQPAPALPSLLPAVPVLAVLATAARDPARADVTLRTLPDDPLFAERELPGLVGDWLRAD
jgi:hypothetical protein